VRDDRHSEASEQPTVGVNPGYPRLKPGVIGVAPLAAVAVDNPSGLSPAVGSETDCPDSLWIIAQQDAAELQECASPITAGQPQRQLIFGYVLPLTAGCLGYRCGPDVPGTF